MRRVAIFGASGYSGHELLKLLARHGRIEIVALVARSEAGRMVRDLYPDWKGDEAYIAMSAGEIDRLDVDLAFLALPNGEAMRIVPRLPERVKVVDISADYRFEDPNTWSRIYEMEHVDPGRPAVYGLTEWNRREVAGARLVANPGCYVTACLTLGLPLARKGLIERVVFDCKSGYSGAGRKPTPHTDPELLRDNIVPYKLAGHRHQAEISEKLGLAADFTPHVLPAFRGILATAHIWTTGEIGADELRRIMIEQYEGEPFIEVLPDRLPTLHDSVNTNKVVLGGFEKDSTTGRIVAVASLDNLVKGAAGQALQNANLMLGLDETEGLK